MAAALAVLAAVVGFVFRRPALTHSLWLLVLLKLITPPLLNIRVPWPERSEPGAGAADTARLSEQPFLTPNPDQIPEPVPFSRELLRARTVSPEETVRARRSSRLNLESLDGPELREIAPKDTHESRLS